MTNTELGLLFLGAMTLLIAIVIVLVLRHFRRDEIFADLTPGQFPLGADDAHRKRVSPGVEYSGPVAVQFTPPAGMSPGLVGTVIDGEAHMHDVTATIVDLAVRGFCTIKTVDAAGAPVDRPEELRGKDKRQQDWLISQTTDINPNTLSSMERRLLSQMFAHGPQVRMSQLTSHFGHAMREAQQNLYHEVVQRGWYPKHPRTKSGLGCLGILGIIIGIMGLLLFGAAGSSDGFLGWVAGALVLAAFIVLVKFGRGRVPRTAEGTAARIQSLGFKQYLMTAEAEQIKFEEAAEIFSRYLPYAIVFGVAQHWAKIFGEVAARAKIQGYDLDDFYLGWFVLDVATDALWWSTMFGGDLFDGGMFDMLGSMDIGELAGTAAEGFAGFAEGVGDFIGSADGLAGLGDGCDGCDLDF